MTRSSIIRKSVNKNIEKFTTELEHILFVLFSDNFTRYVKDLNQNKFSLFASVGLKHFFFVHSIQSYIQVSLKNMNVKNR